MDATRRARSQRRKALMARVPDATERKISLIDVFLVWFILPLAREHIVSLLESTRGKASVIVPRCYSFQKEMGRYMKHYALFDNRVDLVLTERIDGNMKATPDMDARALCEARKNRLKALEAIGLDGSNTTLIRVTYEHTDFCKFIELESARSQSINDDLSIDYSDGVLVNTPNLGIFLPLADCLGVVLYDAQHHALMVVHCGRHTLLQDGAFKAARFMTRHVGTHTAQMQAWFSPCAGKKNYPLYDAGNKGLQEYATEQLQRVGMLRSSIEQSVFDTTTSPLFFSHSQGDTVNRFALCARLR